MTVSNRRFWGTGLLALVLILPLSASAIDFGLKLGMGARFMSGDYHFISDDVTLNLEPKISTNFITGATMRVGITRSFSVQAEALYITKGAGFDETVNVRGQELNLDGKLFLGYAEVPLLFKFSTSLPDRGPLFYPKPGMTYNFYFGPSVAYNVAAKFTGTISGDILGARYEEDFEDNIRNTIKDTDFGIVVGAGFEYGAGDESRYTVDVRYTHGMMDIGDDPQTNLSFKNGVVTVTVGVVW
jgi:hypothetical protein